MTPTDKLWPREPHTEGKHLVLRKYLDAWLPIMGRWNGRILFIDGFAGPGEYAGGEEGSPIIAVKSLLEHQATLSAEVVFAFIEKDPARAAHLAGLVNDLKQRLPGNASIYVEEGQFDLSMKSALDAMEDQRKHLAPAFVMLDPFGVSGTPMAIIRRLMRNPKCELYISFMYESINRFISTPEFAPHLDELFGTTDWRKAIPLDRENRKALLYGLYTDQLREAGAGHAVHFELKSGNRLIYSIFFATKHWKGCDLIKQAIWGVAPFGDYAFVGTRTDQLTLGSLEPNLAPLQRQLFAEFSGREWVPIEEVVAFVGSDATEYHTGHLKKMTLKPMETAGRLVAKEGTRKKRGSYPAGCMISFRC